MPVDKAPFDHKGNLMHYAQGGYFWTDGKYEYTDPDWRDNEPFLASLTLVGMQRGRSAAYFIWEDEEGHQYSMFMSDIVDVIKTIELAEGKTRPDVLWIIKKRGTNFGIGLA